MLENNLPITLIEMDFLLRSCHCGEENGCLPEGISVFIYWIYCDFRLLMPCRDFQGTNRWEFHILFRFVLSLVLMSRSIVIDSVSLFNSSIKHNSSVNIWMKYRNIRSKWTRGSWVWYMKNQCIILRPFIRWMRFCLYCCESNILVMGFWIMTNTLSCFNGDYLFIFIHYYLLTI